ncbi:MAG TPA: FAD-dependent oxidoreductase [Rhizobiaceae bacterium]|nr:FAD-dependent oxidoreductase [Rhizobiaceae bacterium]
MREIVIIGAGECGVRAAFAVREQGFDGSLTLLGAEAALPYERPPLSKTNPCAPKPIRPEASYREAGIDLRRGSTAAAINRQNRKVTLTNGEQLNYDRLLLATGARARRLADMEDCLTLRTDIDAVHIMERFATGALIGIIGGGFIGLELAATARQAGAEATVVEAAPRLLGRAVPEAMAAIVHTRHVTEGVTIRTGTGVTAADANRIELADGTVLGFDAVIAGVGSAPNVELAQAAGLAVDNGIVVDASFRTSDTAIFAAGDCCNFEWRASRVRLESWKAAQDQGAHAAAGMLGAAEAYGKVPWFWSDQYDMTLQVAGLFDMRREVHRRESADGVCLVFQCDDRGRLAAAAGIGPGNTVAKDIRILEKAIERDAVVDADAIASASFNLRQLLK